MRQRERDKCTHIFFFVSLSHPLFLHLILTFSKYNFPHELHLIKTDEIYKNTLGYYHNLPSNSILFMSTRTTFDSVD